MLTAIDKAIIPVLASLVAWTNQKYGFHFNADPAAIGIVVGAVTSIIVYFIPNKEVTK